MEDCEKAKFQKQPLSHFLTFLLLGSSVHRHVVVNMHCSVIPPVTGYFLLHSDHYFKESATFALGLNYVQFAKLRLKPLGGGKAL